jgi:hypothetical protein
VEKGLTLGRVEELRAMTGTAEKATVTADAINALGSALTDWCAPPAPTKTDAEFTRRLHGMTNAVGFVEANVSGAPANLIEACDILALPRAQGAYAAALGPAQKPRGDAFRPKTSI